MRLRLLVVIACAVVTVQGQQRSFSPVDPVETCGSDVTLASVDDLTPITVALAADRRLFSPCEAETHPASHLENRDLALLDRAVASLNDELRRQAVRALGRLGAPMMVAEGDPAAPEAGRLVRLLADRSAVVRAEAANAIGQALSGTRSDLREDAPPSPEQIAFGLAALESQLAKETSDVAVAAILRTVGRLNLADADIDRIAAVLADQATGTPERIEGAVKGLESLIRLHRRRTFARPVVERLRALSGLGRTTTGAEAEKLARIRRLSMLALLSARDTDTTSVRQAAKDPDWQVRMIAVQIMTPMVDVYVPTLLEAFDDPSLQVRIQAIGSQAKDRNTPRACGPIVAAVADAETSVSLRAIDALVPECAVGEETLAMLAGLADTLADTTRAARWHRGARALTTLARLAPESAKSRLTAAVRHPAWQVRAASASVAATLGNETVALQLAADPNANVVSASIDALVRLKSSMAKGIATEALARDDNQVVMSAAAALSGDADAAPKLFETLTRLTRAGSDTSRDARVAIVRALAATKNPSVLVDLAPWAGDWDTAVRTAAIKAHVDAGGSAVPNPPRQYRYPLQPTADDLAKLLEAKFLDLEMDSGDVVTMELMTTEAPLAVARVVRLAQAGYYDGLTFHRIVPNFVVQGGSPGANEYVGDTRFMRDAVGLPSHLRGAVGISTRGYDTGDAQLFIDLVDVPRLDHDYTVFAMVRSGMEIVDSFLEGATIRKAVVR